LQYILLFINELFHVVIFQFKNVLNKFTTKELLYK